jgi:hypothetical protein
VPAGGVGLPDGHCPDSGQGSTGRSPAFGGEGRV